MASILSPDQMNSLITGVRECISSYKSAANDKEKKVEFMLLYKEYVRLECAQITGEDKVIEERRTNMLKTAHGVMFQ